MKDHRRPGSTIKNKDLASTIIDNGKMVLLDASIIEAELLLVNVFYRKDQLRSYNGRLRIGKQQGRRVGRSLGGGFHCKLKYDIK